MAFVAAGLWSLRGERPAMMVAACWGIAVCCASVRRPITSKNDRRSNRLARPKLVTTDLIDKAVLQALQDRFSEKYRVATAILDENADPITFERRHYTYCQEIRGCWKGRETNGIAKCLHVLQRLVAGSGEGGEISETSLRRKFAAIPKRAREEIRVIEGAGIEFAADLSKALVKLDKWQRPQAVGGHGVVCLGAGAHRMGVAEQTPPAT
jgi:hypothetical protein